MTSITWMVGWGGLLRWRYPPRSRMRPRGLGEIIVAWYWILASTHHSWTWWWHRSGSKQRGPDCLNDLFLWILKKLLKLSLLPGHFLICSFFHFLHCLHKHFSLHSLLFVKLETERCVKTVLCSQLLSSVLSELTPLSAAPSLPLTARQLHGIFLG